MIVDRRYVERRGTEARMKGEREAVEPLGRRSIERRSGRDRLVNRIDVCDARARLVDPYARRGARWLAHAARQRRALGDAVERETRLGEHGVFRVGGLQLAVVRFGSGAISDGDEALHGADEGAAVGR